MGLYKHEGAFWESNWNKMDVFVTLSSLSACFVSPAHQGDQIKALRSFRLLRALRPLRMVRWAIEAESEGAFSHFISFGILRSGVREMRKLLCENLM